MIEKLLMYTEMNKSKHVGSLIGESSIADNAKSDMLNEHEHTIYRSIVGSLLYLATRTRPDVAVATSILASHMHAPEEVHMKMAKRVLQYPNGKIAEFSSQAREKYTIYNLRGCELR